MKKEKPLFALFRMQQESFGSNKLLKRKGYGVDFTPRSHLSATMDDVLCRGDGTCRMNVYDASAGNFDYWPFWCPIDLTLYPIYQLIEGADLIVADRLPKNLVHLNHNLEYVPVTSKMLSPIAKDVWVTAVVLKHLQALRANPLWDAFLRDAYKSVLCNSEPIDRLVDKISKGLEVEDRKIYLKNLPQVHALSDRELAQWLVTNVEKTIKATREALK